MKICYYSMAWLLFFGLIQSSAAVAAPRQHKAAVDCTQFNIDAKSASSLSTATPPASCKAGSSNGLPIPDPNCTPGAVNPSVKLDVLQNQKFRTACVRDQVTSLQQKAVTYKTYGIPHPKNNKGPNQTCELDHLVSLELGGADSLENIWPQCGPDGAALEQRYFKQKDLVENYLAHQVKAGAIPLQDAQKGIAKDWTQYLPAAKEFCRNEFCD